MSEVKANGGGSGRVGEGIIMMSGPGAQTLSKADDEVVVGSGVCLINRRPEI